MPVPPSLAPLMPSLEGHPPHEVRAFFRTVDLSARSVDAVRPLAAVVFQADLLVREVREERLEVDPRTARVTEAPPIPEEDPETPQHHRYLRGVASAPHRCTNCPHSPGHTSCPVCGTSGRIEAVSGDHVNCPGCSGRGYVHCGSCDGQGAALWSDTVFVTDALQRVRKVFVDSNVFGDRVFALQNLLADATLPDALVMSLDERSGRGPYRDSAPRERAFHGHRFGDAIGQAQRERDFQLRRKPLRQQFRVYAYPFLDADVRVLRRTYQRLVLVDPEGRPRQWID